MICYLSASYSSGAPRHLPYLRGGAEYQHFIFVELMLFQLTGVLLVELAGKAFADNASHSVAMVNALHGHALQ